MDVRIEIKGETATCKQKGSSAFSAPVDDFVNAIAERCESQPFPEAIPEGVRFVRRRGNVVVLAIEEKPMVRTVRWLADDSPVPYGRRARYKQARLAFPFVIVVVAFIDGALTGQSQCFYRVAPLTLPTNELMLPNLFNVAKAYDQDAWICLVNLKESLKPLSWSNKVQTIWEHIFGASFNGSSEEHEGMSYWGSMLSLDPRVSSLAAWEKESASDPFFVLDVPWKPVGKSIGSVMETMLDATGMRRFPRDATELAQVLSTVGKRKR